MKDSHVELYAHIVWTTSGCEPTITSTVQPVVYSAIEHECTKLGVALLAIGGIEDHVHILVQMPHSVMVPILMQRAKGVSARVANELPGGPTLLWQRGYGAFSISRWDVERVARYIANQRRHHAENTSIRILEPA
ncbi:MAG TPA: IS200/IS605 family transposase [Capsulimonadaceae bacterium]|jgi:REP element-mobilizing transposase RayT